MKFPKYLKDNLGKNWAKVLSNYFDKEKGQIIVEFKLTKYGLKLYGDYLNESKKIQNNP